MANIYQKSIDNAQIRPYTEENMEETLRILEQTEQMLSQKNRKDGKRQKWIQKLLLCLLTTIRQSKMQ